MLKSKTLRYILPLFILVITTTLSLSGCKKATFPEDIKLEAFHFAQGNVKETLPQAILPQGYDADRVEELGEDQLRANIIFFIEDESGRNEYRWDFILQYDSDRRIFSVLEVIKHEEDLVAEKLPSEEEPPPEEPIPEEEPPPEEPPLGEEPKETEKQPQEPQQQQQQQQQQVQNTNIPIVEGECGTFIENTTAALQQGNYISAGDTDTGHLVKGFISFNITSLAGCKVQFASLSLSCQDISNDPSFFGEFRISNAKNWGARPLQKGDYNRDDFVIQTYSAGGYGNVLCENPSLKDAIQNNINGNNNRFQIIISPKPVDASNPGRTNNKSDGFLYFVNGINLYVEFVK